MIETRYKWHFLFRASKMGKIPGPGEPGFIGEGGGGLSMNYRMYIATDLT